MKNIQRSIALVCVVLLFQSASIYAVGPSVEELRDEVFLRGGKAIHRALYAQPELSRLLSRELEANIPPGPPPAAQEENRSRGMSKWAWAGIISGFVVAGALIYYYATGPGASVRNCSTCK